MPVKVLSAVTGVADIGDTWRMVVLVFDKDGVAAAPDSIAGTVTKPDTSTASATVTAETTSGLYTVTYSLAATGRHTAAVTVTDADFGNDVIDFAVEAISGAVDLPSLDDVTAYLGAAADQWTSDDLQAALDAETAAQRSTCRIPSAYPADLGQALLRRVQRNLALRQLPLAVLQGDGESGSLVLNGRDPEVRRLEAPWRRLVVG